MTDAVKKQREYAVAVSGGVCEVCGKPITYGKGQMSHRIGNTLMNRKKYGNFVIDNILNVGMTCSLECNAALDISYDTGACLRLCAEIYNMESLKYKRD